MGVQGLKVCSFLLISYCDDFVLQFSIEKCSNIDVEVNKLISLHIKEIPKQEDTWWHPTILEFALARMC